MLILFPVICAAQSHLDKGVSVKAKQKTVAEVLDVIGRQGKFYFSYNTKVVPADSLVDIDVWNKTVRQALEVLFKGRFEYKETPNHVIIQLPSAGQYWYVSGYVIDELTGERVRDVSVFDANQLVASLTNDQGYFKLRLKDKIPSTAIN
ncbi:MAG: STN domain-containing protein, partial [Taibaiella sp.]|nr:STN domain-containing protein [Taibaiella sp.]